MKFARLTQSRIRAIEVDILTHDPSSSSCTSDTLTTELLEL